MLPPPIQRRDGATLEQWVAAFQVATPVRHVVIDDFLDRAVADELLRDFPDPDAMPKSHDYLFSDKRELSTLDRHSETSASVHEALTSTAFTDLLTRMVGRSIFLDPEYLGGGFHAGGDGSYLDLHTDFNVHPSHPDWRRELNLLLYLNPGWEPSWGGELVLTDTPGRPGTTVAPQFNRMVIMESTERSYHGYERHRFPTGTPRRSVAAYGYSLTGTDFEKRTTNWVPQGAGTGKRVLARHWNTIVLTKNRFFGSGTAKDRR